MANICSRAINIYFLHLTCLLTKVFGKFVLLNVVGHQLLSCWDVDPHVARVLDRGRGYSNMHLQTGKILIIRLKLKIIQFFL